MRRLSKRSGFTLFELLVTTLLLSAAFATVVPLLGAIAAQRRAAEQRQFALQEVANVLERYAAGGWEQATQETAAAVEISTEARRVLPEAELRVTVDETPEAPVGRRITLELRWKDRSGRFTAPARLVTWIYRQGA